MTQKDKLISMKMSPELITKIKTVAKSNGLTMSAQIRLILMEYLKNHNV